MKPSDITIKALSPELREDFLRSCGCPCFHEDRSVVKWSERTAPQNRALACERIERQSRQGYLACVRVTPVGWSNAAPRRLLRAPHDAPTPDAEPVGAMICFLVGPLSMVLSEGFPVHREDDDGSVLVRRLL
jgi:hypothetical protein